MTSSLFIYMGSAALTLGRLAFVLGDLEAARSHYDAALAFHRKTGLAAARLFTEYEYGLLLQHGTARERQQGRLLLESAAQLASAGGVLHLHGRPLASVVH